MYFSFLPPPNFFLSILFFFCRSSPPLPFEFSLLSFLFSLNLFLFLLNRQFWICSRQDIVILILLKSDRFCRHCSIPLPCPYQQQQFYDWTRRGALTHRSAAFSQSVFGVCGYSRKKTQRADKTQRSHFVPHSLLLFTHNLTSALIPCRLFFFFLFSFPG